MIDQRRSSSRGRARTWGPAARGPCPARESTREPKGKPFDLGLSSIRSTRHPSGPRRTAASINRFEVRISAAGDGWLERLGVVKMDPLARDPAPPRPSSSARRRPRAAWPRPPSARTPAAPTPGRSGASTPWLDGRPLEDTTLARLPSPNSTTRASGGASPARASCRAAAPVRIPVLLGRRGA